MNALLPAALALVLLAAPAARASGFLFGENGTRALAQGGAFVAQADDLSAIQHNPAGLSQLRGFHLLADLQLLNHDVTFQRRDPDGSANNISEVSNNAGLFPLPMLGAGYGFPVAGRNLHLAIGAYGPPTVGRYRYAEPDYTRRDPNNATSPYNNDPRRIAAQRYGLIENDILVAYPGLSAAYDLHRTVSVGVSLQYVYATLMFRQSVTSAPFTADSMRREDPLYDSVVLVEQKGKPTLTGVLGVQYRPSENLHFGASWRPRIRVEADGTMDIELGQFARDAGAEVSGNGSTFIINLPHEVKLGAMYRPIRPLTLNAELEYQGWQAVQAFVLEPQFSLTVLGEEREVPQVVIPKKWTHAWGARFGAAWAFDFGLTARAGVMWEQSGIPDEYLNLDFTHFDRVFATGGLEYALGPVSLLVTGAWTPTQEKTVTNSQVRQSTTDTEVEGSVIGNGTYRSGGWILGLGVRGSFGAGDTTR